MENSSYDFVAIGGGLGGLAAAITAADSGLQTIVIEKTDLIGGVTAYSNGQLWVADSHLQARAGIEDSRESGFRYLQRLAMGFGDEALARSYCEAAPEAIRYFADVCGVEWRLVEGLADYYYPDFDDALPSGRYLEVEPFDGTTLGEWRDRLRVSPHVPYRLTHADMWELGGAARAHSWDATLVREREERDLICMGAGLAGYLLRGALQLGVEFLTGANVERLVCEDGGVVGCEVTSEGRTERLGVRKGVLLATGGYDWSDVASALEGHVQLGSAAPPSVTGDHLRLAGKAGAGITRVPKPIRLGYTVPGLEDDGHPVTRILGSMAFPHAILVNAAGQRFCDESFYPSIGHAVKAIDGRQQRFQNWPCWVLFDSQFRENYLFGSVAPDGDFPAEWDLVSGPTLDAVAEQLGIDAAALNSQVDRFNSYCETGVDEEFGRGDRPWARTSYGDPVKDGNPNLGSIVQPPFFAYRPVFVGTGIPTLGLITDGSGRVLDHSQRPIPGLYAAGNSSALTEVGAGYQSGVANMRGLAFGRRAALHAAAG